MTSTLILPPCLFNTESSDWTHLINLSETFKRAGLSVDIWLHLFKELADGPSGAFASVAKACITPLTLEETLSKKWKPFFTSDPHLEPEAQEAAFQATYHKACGQCNFWTPSQESLSDFLTRGGDLNTKDVLGRSWLFFDSTRHQQSDKKNSAKVDINKAFSMMSDPWSPDVLGAPFFAYAHQALAADHLREMPDNHLHILADRKGVSNMNTLSWCLIFSKLNFNTSNPDAFKAMEALHQRGAHTLSGDISLNLKNYAGTAFYELISERKNAPHPMQSVLLSLYHQKAPESALQKHIVRVIDSLKKQHPLVKVVLEKSELNLEIPHVEHQKTSSHRL